MDARARCRDVVVCTTDCHSQLQSTFVISSVPIAMKIQLVMHKAYIAGSNLHMLDAMYSGRIPSKSWYTSTSCAGS